MRCKHALVAILSLTLILPPVVPAVAGEDRAQLEQQIAALERVVAMARELREHIDRSAFDLQALLDRLDYDADAIIEFVRREIAFEQYPGVLRGAQGTLMAQAGNALDQAVLLASLLRDAGYDARIVEGRLSEAQSRTLLMEMLRPPPARAAIGDATAFLAIVKKYASSPPGRDVEQSLTQFVQDTAAGSSAGLFPHVERTAEFVRSEVARAKIDLGEANSLAELIEEARSYYWVQHRETAAQAWQDLHPAFADAEAIDSPSPERFFAKSIPESLQHRLQFQMFIEVRRGSRLEVLPISTPWERPVANLSAVPLVFGSLPDTMVGPGLPALDPDRALRSAAFFAPVFQGQVPEGGRFFDLNGNLIDPMAAGHAASGLFKSVGDAFLNASGSVGGAPAEFALTGQWVEYSFIAPGGETRTIRRTTFDRIGPAARAAASIPDDLAPASPEDARTLVQRHTFMVSAGSTPRGLALDYGLAKMIETYPAVSAMMRLLILGQQPSPGELDRLSKVPAEWSGHLLMFTALDGANTLREGVVSYRSGPALVAHRQGLAAEGHTVAAVDIVSNPRRSFGRRGDEFRADPFANILGGVWETAMEAIHLDAGGERRNTAWALDSALAAEVPIAVLKAGDPLLSELKLSEDALFHLKADLAAGYAVIVPKSAPPDQLTGWWRIDPRTGETVGQLSDGRGSVLIEYLNAFALGYSLGMLACGLVGCAQQFGGSQSPGSNARLGCCIIGNFVMFGIGYLGGVLGAARIAETAKLIGVSAAELWQQAFIVAAGSLGYDSISNLAPLCQ